MSNGTHGRPPPWLSGSRERQAPSVAGGGPSGGWGDDQPVDRRPAGIGKRAAAFLLDFVLLSVALVILFTVTGLADTLLASSTMVSGTGPLSSAIVVVAVVLAYFVLLEGATGQTIAKRALGIKVVMDDGAPVTLAAACRRRLPLLVAMVLPWLRTLAVFGVELAMLVTAVRDQRRHRGFHDVWAGTRVIDV